MLDYNPDITIKAEGFHAAFNELYKDYIEYVPSVDIKGVDVSSKTIITEFDRFTFEDASITNPRQREKIFGQDDHVRLFGKDYAKRIEPEIIAEQRRVCEIAAPTFQEEKRGLEFKRIFETLGLKNVRIDTAGNVIGERPGKSARPNLLVAAHLDTVFPEFVGEPANDAFSVRLQFTFPDRQNRPAGGLQIRAIARIPADIPVELFLPECTIALGFRWPDCRLASGIGYVRSHYVHRARSEVLCSMRPDNTRHNSEANHDPRIHLDQRLNLALKSYIPA